MKMNPMLLTDFYKLGHRAQYPQGTELIYSTFTPRTSRIDGINEVVFFGLQGFIKEYLMDYFTDNFFNVDKMALVDEYKRLVKNTLGDVDPYTKHIEDLHDLGYMPVKICAVEEGTKLPIRVPMFTIENTLPEFFWVTNFLETFMSACMWKPTTVATISNLYREICEEWADKTADSRGHIPFQCHNFSMRGLSGFDDLLTNGAAHLTSFSGTDTIPSILYCERYYNSNIEKELVGASIAASEHSVQCTYGDDEKYFSDMINKIYPNGLVSIVSDGYDYWKMLTEVIPSMKNDIMKRDGKVVVRPDSGDPALIICGTAKIEDFTNNEYVESFEDAKDAIEEILVDNIREKTPHGEWGSDNVSGIFKYDNQLYSVDIEIRWDRYDKQYYFIEESFIKSCKEIELSPEQKGSIEILWDVFGGSINSKGYKVLDSHIGLIYGDAITPERAREIFKRLEAKGFSAENIVFGVGSYSLGYHTRDTFGMALKSTYAVVNGEEKLIFKDPKTDSGVKKSQKGMVAVIKAEDQIGFTDGLNKVNKASLASIDLLQPVFIDGDLIFDDTLQEIRKRVVA